jgi:hypothetical protein
MITLRAIPCFGWHGSSFPAAAISAIAVNPAQVPTKNCRRVMR